MPPVYSGIVPSLLPAFFAPTEVSVVPSCFASSGETASALVLKIAAKPAASKVFRNMKIAPWSECGLERERDPAAVGERRVRAVGDAHDAAVGCEPCRHVRVVAEIAVVL